MRVPAVVADINLRIIIITSCQCTLLSLTVCEFWRDAPSRVVDDGIRQPGLQPGGDRIPYGLLEGRQESPVEEARVPGEPDEVGIRALEAHELRIRINESCQRPDDAVEPNECPVPVARNRQPLVGRSFPFSCPAPLVRMTVPIANEDVEEPRRQQRARIDAFLGVLLEARE